MPRRPTNTLQQQGGDSSVCLRLCIIRTHIYIYNKRVCVIICKQREVRVLIARERDVNVHQRLYKLCMCVCACVEASGMCIEISLPTCFQYLTRGRDKKAVVTAVRIFFGISCVYSHARVHYYIAVIIGGRAPIPPRLAQYRARV